MKLRLVALLAGVAFGFVLGWARLTEPEVIRAMLELREPDVFLLMGSAIATAALAARALRALRVRSVLTGEPVAWTTEKPALRHLVGSALFGLGWSVAATCPGPAAAQLGRGQWMGAFTIAGLLVGVALAERTALRRRALRTARGPESGAGDGLEPAAAESSVACAGL